MPISKCKHGKYGAPWYCKECKQERGIGNFEDGITMSNELKDKIEHDEFLKRPAPAKTAAKHILNETNGHKCWEHTYKSGNDNFCFTCDKKVKVSWDENSAIEQPTITMTERDHVAIALKVPTADQPWINEMIQKARRDEFVKAVAASYYGDSRIFYSVAEEAKSQKMNIADFISKAAHEAADALIKASDEGMGK